MNGSMFVERIDLTLKRKNKKRQALADYCGVTVQSISDWARRGNFPQADITIRIAEFLGVSIEWLVQDNYESNWDNYVDKETNQIKLSPLEIMYRIDSVLKEKAAAFANIENDEKFYNEILDIFSIDEIFAMKSNHYEPNIRQLYTIATRYHLSLDWLLKGQDETKVNDPDMYIYRLALTYPDLLKFYHSLADSDKKISFELIVHLFKTKQKIRDHIMSRGLDVKDIPDLIQ